VDIACLCAALAVPPPLQAPARGRLMGGAAAAAATDDASTVHLQDVLSTLERDPLYSRSGMLYRLYNMPHTSGAL
jgi:hypothetical protein